MSRVASVKMADILLSMGFNDRKSLIACGIPYPKTIRIESDVTGGTHIARIKDSIDGNSADIVGGFAEYDKTNFPVINKALVESTIKLDSSSWSLGRSKLSIKYSNNTHIALYFGFFEDQSISTTPGTHRLSIPMPPLYPGLNFYKPDYPPPEW